MQTELTEAMREESWSNWEKARAGVAEISRIMEKLDKEIEGMGFEQQNQMFDKQAEWNSAKQQKERLKEAGLNPEKKYYH